MKEFRYLRKGIICTVVQLIAWLWFSLVDFCAENWDINLWAVAIIVIPLITVIAYCALRKNLYEKEIPGIKDVALFIINWIIVAVLLGVLITEMTCNWNVWLVHQSSGFLNGIEYPLFAFWIGITIPFATIVLELLFLLGRYIKKQTAEMPETAGEEITAEE